MKTEIKSLTGLRGVAATLVMVDHYAAIDFSYPFPLDLLPHMYLAVDMFMVLSGFILAMTYEDRLTTVSAPGYWNFLLRRIARLYPIYALTTVVCFVLCRMGWLTFLNPDTSYGALLANLLAIQTWVWPGSSLNGPGWSISTEWFANLVFPLLMPLMLRRSLALVTAISGLAFVTLIISALMFGQLFDVPSSGAVNIISGPQALGRCVTEFLIGMYCWRLRSRVPAMRALADHRVQFALLLALAVLMQFTELDTVFVAVCCLLLIGLSFESSGFSAALRSAPLVYLGRISYSLYLIHITLLPLRDELGGLFRRHDVPAAWTWAVLSTAAVAIMLATFSWRYLERPSRSHLRSVLRPEFAGGSR
ncbi:acyltransferase family protein [Roseomonas elaeocarpi]|uniref:Acyltransferase family protein n=1 Tax=Roseomonas elaeocarpi TaxID=907779 RepID=A0ABV6JNJ2_9PROT